MEKTFYIVVSTEWDEVEVGRALAIGDTYNTPENAQKSINNFYETFEPNEENLCIVEIKITSKEV